MMIPEHIAGFERAASTYDEAATLQQQAARRLVGLIPSVQPPPQSILDVGAGTGTVARLLHEVHPHAALTLQDHAPSMLLQARTHLPGATCWAGDMDTMQLAPHDWVVSNFSLQWSCDSLALMHKLYKTANRLLAFSCLLEPTLSAWRDLFVGSGLPAPTRTYADETTWRAALAPLQPECIHTEILSVWFDTPYALARHLQRVGACYSCQRYTPSQLRRVLQHAQPIRADYHVLWAVCPARFATRVEV